jgi:hypothetical protein
MEKKRLFIKGIISGVLVFIFAEAFSWFYLFLTMLVLRPGMTYTPFRGFVGCSLDIVYWICKPFSHIIFLFFDPSTISSGVGRIVFVKSLDLIFWLVFVTVILFLRNKKKLSAPK